MNDDDSRCPRCGYVHATIGLDVFDVYDPPDPGQVEVVQVSGGRL